MNDEFSFLSLYHVLATHVCYYLKLNINIVLYVMGPDLKNSVNWHVHYIMYIIIIWLRRTNQIQKER